MIQAAEVHGDEIAVLQLPLGRHAVRQAGVRAGDGDGVEGRALGAELVQPVDELGAQLLLRHARADNVEQVLKRAVGDLLRLFHVFDLPRLLGLPRGVDLGGIGVQNGVQLRVVERVLFHGQRIVFKAQSLDGMGGDGVVDELGVGMVRVGHDDGKAGQVLLGRFDIAKVGEVVALLLADDRHALCHTVFRGIHPVMLRGQKQCVDFALGDQVAVFFNVFHDGSSIFRLQ